VSRLVPVVAKREILEMNLRELRQAAGKTQEQVATAAKMKQSELSRAERREDHLLSKRRGLSLGCYSLAGNVQIPLPAHPCPGNSLSRRGFFVLHVEGPRPSPGYG